jgi:molybdopterin-guanine dinucleotide biosynthesis protein A
VAADSVGPAERFAAVVLAGDRGPDDPLALGAGVRFKALVPVGGRPMVLRVLDALGRSPSVGRRVLCGPPREALAQDEGLREGTASGAWDWLPPGPTPSTSALAALQTLPESVPVLLTTADHAVLRPEIVEYFCERARASGCDLVAGLARYEEVMAAFPGMRRTGLRFRDDLYSGCNLYAFLSPSARGAADFWRRIERERKRPWRMMRALGWATVARYVTGRLTLDQALNRLSRRLGIRIGVVLLPFPEAAVDVDKPDDREFAERILAGGGER